GVASSAPDSNDILLGEANDIAGTVTIAAPAISATTNGVVQDLTFRNVNAAAVIPTFTGGISLTGLLSATPNTPLAIASTTAVTNTVTTTTAHGLVNGDLVTLSGVTGDASAQGTFRITVTGATTFTLNGATITGGGTAGSVAAADLQ